MLPTRGQRLASSLSRSIKVAKRNFAAAVPLTDPIEDTTAPSRTRSTDASTAKITTLQNGIKVASIDTGASISRVSVLTNVGSRHETAANLGINHLLKNAAFMDNGERTSLRTVREVQEVGGSLDATSSRETSSRNAAFLRNRLAEIMGNIAPGITQPLFETWQVEDAKNMCLLQNATVRCDDTASNLEALHHVAYRSGLGNSLYSNNLNLGTFTSEDLDQFSSESFVGNKMVIAGTDVDHDELLRCAKDLFGDLPSGDKDASQKQRYFGGDIRTHTSNELTCASLLSEGVGFSSADLASFIVLQRILGVGAYTKWGDNTQSSRLSKATRAVCDGPLSINALNISYSDSGLFGFNAVSTPQQIGAVMKAAIGEINGLSKGQLSTEELQRAKTQAKAAILMLGETKEDLLDDLAKQITFTGQYVTPSDGIQNIDQVTVDSVAKAAKSLLSGKSSMSVTGNTASAPYVDDLM
jgi:ubiquinol-cytochrome c reductase core subunit 2